MYLWFVLQKIVFLHKIKQMNINKLINWCEVSETLTGKKTTIRQNKIPKKYKEKIDVLKGLIEYWDKFYLNPKP